MSQNSLTPNQLHVRHLFQSSFLTAPDPLSQAFYLKSLQTASSKSITMPESVKARLCCPDCFINWIPGWTLSVRLHLFGQGNSRGRQRKQSRKQKSLEKLTEKLKAKGTNPSDLKITKPKKLSRKRVLRYTCLNCDGHQDFALPTVSELIGSKNISTHTANKITAVDKNFSINNPSNFTTKESNNTTKTKLASLLKPLNDEASSSKKRAKARKQSASLQQMMSKKKEQENTTSLNLMDFMK
ncbi:hypothetical protein NADFUDRAFT_49733 [Nadsonia fulvescens var. elongata DSM 6958]|uniref:Rpr2-domain-containing protein n=1 Tax=Nadsonia fulvescens var. elongata DSM 6958 TaxID=857566 RepID=A0A1E3PPD9_9ASCO|nr:hypothetical protein NADFUDRAFT_49733 [Nadsonia fulvescens var. elongata DSM 6958]